MSIDWPKINRREDALSDDEFIWFYWHCSVRKTILSQYLAKFNTIEKEAPKNPTAYRLGLRPEL